MTAPTKADTAAAERLLKKAVARAVADFYKVVRTAPRSTALTIGYKSPVVHGEVVAMLTAAGQSAALLLGEDAL